MRSDDSLIQPTSFAAPPPDLPASSIPTPHQLSVLFNAARDYDIRVSDRVRLFAGVRPDHVDELAQRFTQDGVTTDFTSVTDRGNGSIDGRAVIRYDRQIPDSKTGAVPFIIEGGMLRISGPWACAGVGVPC